MVYVESFKTANVKTGKVLLLRASLYCASYEHRHLKLRASSGEQEGVKKATAAIEKMARGVSTENRTEEGVIRSDDHFHASSFLRSLDPLLTSFRYKQEELTIAAVLVTAGV